jgi:catechol 2,3-dioxygenase-like lactoylglutathione lyase family enzyme
MLAGFAEPLLPCPDLDEAIEFYELLGFQRTYRQIRPNPYGSVERSGIGIGLFGIDGFDPAESLRQRHPRGRGPRRLVQRLCRRFPISLREAASDRHPPYPPTAQAAGRTAGLHRGRYRRELATALPTRR